MSDLSPTAAERIAAFTSSLTFEQIPDEVVEAAKLHLLDALGCGIAAHALDVATEGRAAMAELGRGDASVIGLDVRLPAPNAALANGMLCHGLDYDDTHSDSVCHITVAVAPAALAVAESLGSSGKDVLTAVVAGTETVARIGMAASGAFHARGLHPTSACGVFGAAAASARLGALDADVTTRALGLAGSMSSGLLAFLNEGTQTKPVHPGWAAHAGVLAARLAAYGAQGPAGVLERRYGLFHAFLGKESAALEEQLIDLGSRWETLRSAYKFYPACHFMHGSLGATASLVGQVAVDEIDEVSVAIPEPLVPVVLEPREAKLAPRTPYEAKFSLQFSTAAMLVNGDVDLRTYSDDVLRDPAVLELAAKVRHEGRFFETYPVAFPGATSIRTKDGRSLEARLEHQPGAPQYASNAQDVRRKFRGNASLALDPSTVAAAEDAICALEHQDDLSSVLSLLSPQEVVA
jgi:2-methylcitrate dehydratase PrpD